MNPRDFHSDDNFWTQLFEGGLNFRFEKPGEPAVYGRTGSRDKTGPQFARIAVLHIDSGPGRVALIAGTSMEGTEAAGYFFVNPTMAEEVMRLFPVQRVEDLPDFELVLQTHGIGEASRGARIVAHRKVLTHARKAR